MTEERYSAGALKLIPIFMRHPLVSAYYEYLVVVLFVFPTPGYGGSMAPNRAVQIVGDFCAISLLRSLHYPALSNFLIESAPDSHTIALCQLEASISKVNELLSLIYLFYLTIFRQALTNFYLLAIFNSFAAAKQYKIIARKAKKINGIGRRAKV